MHVKPSGSRFHFLDPMGQLPIDCILSSPTTKKQYLIFLLYKQNECDTLQKLLL